MKIMLPILWYDSFIALTSVIDYFKYGNEIRYFAPPYHIYLLPACSGASRSLIPEQSGRFRADYAAYVTF